MKRFLLVHRLVQSIDAILGGVGPVDEREATLVALAAAGELLPRAKRRAHRQRIAELGGRAGPLPR